MKRCFVFALLLCLALPAWADDFPYTYAVMGTPDPSTINVSLNGSSYGAIVVSLMNNSAQDVTLTDFFVTPDLAGTVDHVVLQGPVFAPSATNRGISYVIYPSLTLTSRYFTGTFGFDVKDGNGVILKSVSDPWRLHVPEPSSIILLGVGLFSLVRKRRSGSR